MMLIIFVTPLTFAISRTTFPFEQPWSPWHCVLKTNGQFFIAFVMNKRSMDADGQSICLVSLWPPPPPNTNQKVSMYMRSRTVKKTLPNVHTLQTHIFPKCWTISLWHEEHQRIRVFFNVSFIYLFCLSSEDIAEIPEYENVFVNAYISTGYPIVSSCYKEGQHNSS